MYKIFVKKYIFNRFHNYHEQMLPEFFIFAKDKQILWHCSNASIAFNTMILIYVICPASIIMKFCSHKGLNVIIRSQPYVSHSGSHVPFILITSLKEIYFPYIKCGL